MSKLTQAIFAQGVGLIAARWNRDVDPNVSAVMAEWLDSHGCTGDEFIAGVKRAVAEDEWPPSAKRILELARPQAAPDARAGEVFARVLELRQHIPGHGLRLSLDEVRSHLGEAAMRAVIAIGGASRLTGLTDEARPFVQKDFARAFTEFALEMASRASTSLLVARERAREQERLQNERGPASRRIAAGDAE